MEGALEVLAQKREQVTKLNQEIRDIEAQIIHDTWKDIPICDKGYYEIRDGKCPHGEVYHGNIYCKHKMCDK